MSCVVVDFVKLGNFGSVFYVTKFGLVDIPFNITRQFGAFDGHGEVSVGGFSNHA